MGIDKSNPFSRSGDEVELYREYGAGGRTISFPDANRDDIREGTGPAVDALTKNINTGSGGTQPV